MDHILQNIQDALQRWPEVAVTPHELSGLRFSLDRSEIGHLHTHGMLDLQLPPPLKSVLLAEGHVSEHHILPRPDWASFFLEKDDDEAHALWLLRLSYLGHLLTDAGPAPEALAESRQRARALLPSVQLSPALRAVFDHWLSAQA